MLWAHATGEAEAEELVCWFVSSGKSKGCVKELLWLRLRTGVLPSDRLWAGSSRSHLSPLPPFQKTNTSTTASHQHSNTHNTTQQPPPVIQPSPSKGLQVLSVCVTARNQGASVWRKQTHTLAGQGVELRLLGARGDGEAQGTTRVVADLFFFVKTTRSVRG